LRRQLIPSNKVEICHYDADEDAYFLISISANAVQQHLDNHGDGFPGQLLPSDSNYKFDEDCNVYIIEAFTSETKQGGLTSSGGEVVLSFTGLPEATSDVTITAFVTGDLGDLTTRLEFYDVLDESSEVIENKIQGTCDFLGIDCCSEEKDITVTAEKFNFWNSDGTVGLKFDASSNVNLFCAENYVKASFTYTAIVCPED
jgi:hypothetical protein